MAIKKSNVTKSTIKPLEIDFGNINLIELIEQEIDRQILENCSKNQYIKISLSKYFIDLGLFGDLVILYTEAGWNVLSDTTNKNKYIFILS